MSNKLNDVNIKDESITIDDNYVSYDDFIDREIQNYIDSYANFESSVSDEYIFQNNIITNKILSDLQNVYKTNVEKDDKEKKEIEQQNINKDVNKIKSIIDVLVDYNK